MPLQKNDKIFVIVSKNYVESTAIDILVPIMKPEGEPERSYAMIAKFIEYDASGNIWLESEVKEKGTKCEIMIPGHYILFMLKNPSKEIQKKIGFLFDLENQLV